MSHWPPLDFTELPAAVERLRPPPDTADHVACDDFTREALIWQLRAKRVPAPSPFGHFAGIELRMDPAVPPGVVEMRARDGRVLHRLVLGPSP